jgi:K+-sensing histidine kinase KdpD
MLLPEQLKKPKQSLYYVLIAVIILISASSAFYIYKKVESTSIQHLLDRINTLGAVIPAEQMQQIAGAESDLENPAYQKIKQMMMDVAAANPDLRWVYMMGQRDDKSIFIYGDSEDPSSEDYAPPGLPYEEASEKMYQVFEDGKSVTEPTHDRWGKWISAYAPIINKTTGEVVAFVGIDITANEYMKEKLMYSSLPLLVGLFLLTLVYSIQYSRNREFHHVEQRAEFLSVATHEVRTPLNGIRWALEKFIKEKAEALHTEDRSTILQVYENCLKLVSRINNLLSATAQGNKKGRIKKEEVAIKPLFEDIVDILALSAQEKKASLNIGPSITNDLRIPIDIDAMRHAFFNLISNAIKYTTEGTSVDISYKQDDQNHIFMVMDHGTGILNEEKESVFDSANNLGLFLAKRTVEQHGGTLTYSSTQGQNTVFTVILPSQSR